MTKALLSGAILIGGQSRRMDGFPKGRLLLDGQSLLTRTINLLKERCHDVHLIGDYPERYPEWSDLVVPDMIKERGAPGGVHSALVHASEDWVLVTSCDLPLLTSNTLDQLQPRDDADLVMFTENGRRQPLPSLWRRALLDPLSGLLIGESPGLFQLANEFDTHFVECNDPRALTNVNDPVEAHRVGLTRPV